MFTPKKSFAKINKQRSIKWLMNYPKKSLIQNKQNSQMGTTEAGIN